MTSSTIQFSQKRGLARIVCLKFLGPRQLGLLLFVWLLGCSTPPPPIAKKPPPDPAVISALLAKADKAVAANYLDYPKNDNAVYYFTEVLTLDPTNNQALRGRESIVESYLTEAQTAVNRGQFPKARSMVARAKLIDPKHPGVEPATQQISLLASADRRRVTFDTSQLNNRSQALVGDLTYLGKLARRPGCRAAITSRNDAEGRWLYQQMKKSPGENRIRAQMQTGSPSVVEIVCLAAESVR